MRADFHLSAQARLGGSEMIPLQCACSREEEALSLRSLTGSICADPERGRHRGVGDLSVCLHSSWAL